MGDHLFSASRFGGASGEAADDRGPQSGSEPVASLPSRTARRGVDAPPAGAVPVRPRRRRPMIVGLGGTGRPDCVAYQSLATALATMAQAGAETALFGAGELDLPMYNPDRPERTSAALRLLAAVERCDAVVIAAAAWHGAASGLVKNALDYLEDLRGAPRPYLDGRAVGLIVSAADPQAAGTTLAGLRATVHQLRGWPTPLGVTLAPAEAAFDPHGRLRDPVTAGKLETLADQIMGFIYAWSQVI
ncbi:NADPH-dependent FMN reductase [Frankia sp. AgKG'84/4]|uniref:NADPH-dependent FMN reductase n=1 Tax=Frankia sp. AgKG'84/4 TaxID=573490 RepID=UPI00200DF101|nr:NAD(P)H-dependent oxidoreductase [Frankia sp. AgKG'84/4]MCL9795381.1 NAD(P)H-dependent oxidoreductase [Frankia sp. AgKG'84/4]